MSTLIVRQLGKDYPATHGGSLPILRGVDLTLDRGDALAVIGPSGAGKSTLLYLLGLLDTPNRGTVELAGINPFALSPDQQAEFRNQRIGFIFQEHHLLPQCSVVENVLIPTLASREGATAAREARARQLLDRVGLTSRAEHRPAELSGGERQRVAVCRALINEPVLLLADEPTGNLDRTTAETVGSLLLELQREQQAILICVTHSADLAARFPRQVELIDGELRPR